MTNCQFLKWFLERKQILILIINKLKGEKMTDINNKIKRKIIKNN